MHGFMEWTETVLPSPCLFNDGPFLWAYSVKQYDDHLIVNCCGLILGIIPDFPRRYSRKSRKTIRIADLCVWTKVFLHAMEGCPTKNAWFEWVLVNTTVKVVFHTDGIHWTSATTINATKDSATYKHDKVYWIHPRTGFSYRLLQKQAIHFFFLVLQHEGNSAQK